MSEDRRHPVAEILVQEASAGAVHRLRARVGRASKPRPTKALLRWAAGATALAVIVSMSIGKKPKAERVTLRTTQGLISEGWQRSSQEGVQGLSLEDGTTLEFEDDTKLRLRKLDGARVVFELSDGTVDLEVTPGGPRKWRVSTAELDAIVVGTRFRVETGPGWSQVTVREGRVQVDDKASTLSRILHAGQSIRFPPARSEPPAARPKAPSSPPPPKPAKQRPAHPKPYRASTSLRRVNPEGQARPRSKVARRRQARPGLGVTQVANNAEAARAVEDTPDAVVLREGTDALGAGEPSPVATSTGTAELRLSIQGAFRRADKARSQGQFDVAERWLLKVIESQATRPERALAMFELGTIYMDAYRRPRDAERWLSEAMRLGLPNGVRRLAAQRRNQLRTWGTRP